MLLAAAFPFRAGDVRFDAGALAGWLALVPFAYLLRGLGPRRAFLWGTGAGTLAYALVLYWIFVVVHVQGEAPAWVAVLAVLGLSAYIGCHVGAAGALVAALEPHAGQLGFAVLPAAWVICEQLRTVDLWGGFPWAFLGYAAHLDGPLLELAGFGGVLLLSFALATFASLAARRRYGAALAVLALAHGPGLWLRFSPASADPAEPRSLEVALVQGNIPQDEKWDPASARADFEAHMELSRRAAREGKLDLIAWPETSVPVSLEFQPDYREEVLGLARETGAVLLVGGMGLEPIPAERAWRFFNSVFAVTPEGGYVARYDKSRLVPFGEYVPLRSVLGFLSGLATGLSPGDITPGPGPRALVIPGLGPEHAVAPLICYEVIYPSVVREAVRGGARVLLNATNDAWYGRTSAPHQFMAIAAMRSAEHGVPMLRAANTGVSAIVDSRGRVLQETPIFERQELRGRLPPGQAGTALYTRLGDWVVWASAALLVAIGGRRFAGRGRATDEGAARAAR